MNYISHKTYIPESSLKIKKDNEKLEKWFKKFMNTLWRKEQFLTIGFGLIGFYFVYIYFAYDEYDRLFSASLTKYVIITCLLLSVVSYNWSKDYIKEKDEQFKGF